MNSAVHWLGYQLWLAELAHAPPQAFIIEHMFDNIHAHVIGA